MALQPAGSNTISARNPVLSVVIPALNEEAGIADIVARVRAATPSINDVGIKDVEIIVVDDGSKDDTSSIVASLSRVKLLKHSQNRGYGAAIKTGFSQAKGHLLAFLDADSTYPPEHFSRLCEVVLREQADIVVGSRRSGADSQMPLLRRLGNFIWSNLVSLLGDKRVVDPASGMRVLKRSILPRLYPLPDGLNFTPVMSTRAIHEGLNLVEVPIPYHERSGDSKLSVVRDGTRFLKTIVWTALEYNPARPIGFIGLGALFGAFVIGFSIVLLRLQGVTELGPWGVFSTFSALVLSVTGASVFSLGVTFDYLVALFQGKPMRQNGSSGPLFRTSLYQQFGWLGLSTAFCGLVLAAVSLALGLRGWEIARLWLWLLGSALLILVGIQLSIWWVILQVMEALNIREVRIGDELKVDDTSFAQPPEFVRETPTMSVDGA